MQYSAKKFKIEKVFPILLRETNKYPLPLAEQVAYDYNGSAFHVLIATMLSARSRDEMTAKVVANLFKAAGTAEKIAKLPLLELEKIIRPIGFYKDKSKHVSETAKKIVEQYKGIAPSNREGLESLPGVGRKTANIVLNVALGEPSIAVDVHVHRISNRLGYIKTKTPQESETALTNKLPTKFWRDYNRVLVLWGQKICTPQSPWCSKCPVNQYCQREDVEKGR